MMADDEPEIGGLALLQIVLQPHRVCSVQRLSRADSLAAALPISLLNDEVGVRPIERVVRRTYIEEIIELRIVALMVAESREKGRLAKEIVFDIEEDPPQCRIGAVRD
jgi:hypothetical protein